MKKISIIGLLFFSLNLFSQEMASLKVGDKFPGFQLETIDGNLISLESLKGKVVFINLWFTRCPPCILEMPTLNEVQNIYKDRVEFISITFDQANEVNRFLAKREFKFQHLINAKDFLFGDLKNTEYPKNIILDRTGTITFLEGSLPFIKDPKTGEMVPVSHPFLKPPLEKALSQKERQK
ncbi:MAG: TlpA disulfide reductase family protein [Gillisia sp.]